MTVIICSAVYNGVGFVKRHDVLGAPGAGSRAARRFRSGRSSQTLEAAKGAHKI